MSTIICGEFVARETEAAVVLHLRRGSFMPCGKQDTETLCDSRPAWDTRCPPAVFAGDDKRRLCRTCSEIYARDLSRFGGVLAIPAEDVE